MTLKIFISYQHGDKSIVHKIAYELKQLPFIDIWIDYEQIYAGADIVKTINEQINQSNLVICFLSNNYFKSKICLHEQSYAANSNRKILYVLLCERKEIPDELKRVMGDIATFNAYKQPEVFQPEQYFNDNFERLISNLRSLYPEKIPFTLPSNVLGKPVQLIKQIDGNLVLDEQYANIIRAIKDPISVIAIIGPQRTGKSYIMNRLINRSDGFVLGSTYDSCTRGILMWSDIVNHINQYDHKMSLIYLDTEGLESDKQNPQWDAKIFILTLLMSSVFVYNTMKVINRDAIKKLAIMSELADRIKIDKETKEIDNKNCIATECPDFFWALRDCYLEAKETDTIYLEKCLQLEPEKNNEQEDKEIKECNYIKTCIKEAFNSRDCFRLPLPVTDSENMTMEEKLCMLDRLSFDELRKVFNDKMKAMCNKIHRIVTYKTVNGQAINGIVYVEYIKHIIDSINRNKEIFVGESLIAGIRNVANEALEQAQNSLIAQFDDLFQKEKLPIPWNQFNLMQQTIVDQCYDIIKVNIIGSEDIAKEYTAKFHEFIAGNADKNELFDTKSGKLFEYREKNSKQIYESNKKLLKNLWDRNVTPMLDRTGNNKIQMEKFLKKEQEVMHLFDSQAFDGPEKLEVVKAFYETINIDSLKCGIEKWNKQCDEMITMREHLVKAEADRKRQEDNHNKMIKEIDNERKKFEEMVKKNDELNKQKFDTLNDELKEKERKLKSLKKSLKKRDKEVKERISQPSSPPPVVTPRPPSPPWWLKWPKWPLF